MLTVRKAVLSDLKRINFICRMTAGEKSRTDEKTGRITELTYSDYYGRKEYDNSFILDDNGTAVGYILSAPDYKKFKRDYRKCEINAIRKISIKKAFEAYFIPLHYFPFAKEYPAHLHIDILPEYQGKGLGSKMMNEMTAHLKSHHIKGVMIIADINNKKAIKFYEKNGFIKLFSGFGGIAMGLKLK